MSHRTHSKKRSAQAVIFLAPHLDAQQFIHAYYQFHAAGYLLTTVAVRAGVIGCRHGVLLSSNYTVSSYLQEVGTAKFDALIILGKSEAARAILTDPRILEILQIANATGKPVYCSSMALQLINKLGLSGTALQAAPIL